ncbi:MAG: sodium-extruding oxaloacetate decarboxylase subunit alpha [Treponema sp.]|nr:sodium-extruding oxaloacetate decarboxylase subunit alpha [Treponema sp.]
MAKIQLSELVLRDAHQSLLATRMTTADMLPACPLIDKIGYFSAEAWGGATYDSCIRFLNEDPWERLRALHAAMPNTKIMMLLRGQNLLGYRHYADDVVDKFVATAAQNGVDVFRIFDACNDPRNLDRAAKAAKKTGRHVQMAISYATTPYHTKEVYAELAERYAQFGADSICIKDMSGLLKPYEVYDLVKAIKGRVDLPLEIHSHATTGLSVATLLKAAEAGADILDTTISALAMGTSHSPTETVVEMFKGTEYDTELDIAALLEIAAYFREVRKHYSSLESKFLGADTRILVSQVPGGMLSNLESQLKEQGAADKIDAVLKEIPVVQKDVGYVPLVTPTSQIVGTQAVFNVLFGRYVRLTQEFRDLLTGRYGATPAPVNADVQAEALKQNAMESPVTCRPADLIENEWDKCVADAAAAGGNGRDEDVLTYAMFPKVAEKFFQERVRGPVVAEEKFRAASPVDAAKRTAPSGTFTVTVNGTPYQVATAVGSDTVTVNGTPYVVSFGAPSAQSAPGAAASAVTGGMDITAPVAGTLLRFEAADGAAVKKGETVIVIESMKMELEVKAPVDGNISFGAAVGSQITAGQVLATIGGVRAAAPAAPVAAPAAPAVPVANTVPAGGKVVNAPVAGTLLRFESSEGATVQADTTIIIIESMKMELEIKAGTAGTVHYLAQPGTQIGAGQPIAEIV